MTRPLRVAVYRDRYPTRFVTPRKSRHTILRQRFLPLNFVSKKLEGLTLIEPAPRVDIVHAFNRIPINASKYIISFESHLPRQFALRPDGRLARYLSWHIEQPGCRRILALSHFAKRSFMNQHALSLREKLARKLMVRHPNVVVPATNDRLANDDGSSLVLTFVGAHFGRKGGCVAVKIAEKALALGMPLRVNIVSALEVGGAVWTDPTVSDFFAPYLKLLDLPNVTFRGSLPNSEVRTLLGMSHFSILTTFADTFGYSAIESMSEHTPVIGTNVCALPEFLTDRANAIVLPVELTENGEWCNPGFEQRGEAIYARHFEEEIERLASLAIERLGPLIGDAATLAAMRREARRTAETMFGWEPAAKFYDDLYERVAAEPKEEPAILTPGLDLSSPEHYKPLC